MKKLMIFIDAEHVTKTCRENEKYLNDIDWKELVEKIIQNRELIRCYYYTALNENNKRDFESGKKYLGSIKENIKPHSIEFRLGELKQRNNGGFEQKGVDVKLAIDMLTKAFRNQYDVAAIITGDFDFKDLIDEVKNNGKKVELYYLERKPNKMNVDLLNAADISIEIKYLDISMEQKKLSAMLQETTVVNKIELGALPKKKQEIPKSETHHLATNKERKNEILNKESEIELFDIVTNCLEAHPEIYKRGTKKINVGLLSSFITKTYFADNKDAIAKFLKVNGGNAKKIDSRIFQRFPHLYEFDRLHNFMEIKKIGVK